MKFEQTIVKKWKFHVYGFLVLLLIQIIGFFLMNTLLKEFIGQPNVYKVMLIIITMICILVDFCFFYNRVIILRCLMNKIPIKCKIVDIFLIGYKEDTQTRYAPFLIVQSTEDKKLYLTYGKYSLLDYSTIFNYSDRENIYCTIYRDNAEPVQLGDTVDMYLLKKVDVPVYIDRSKNIVKLKRKKVYFRHMNKEIDIDIFKDLIFFMGAIDLL